MTNFELVFAIAIAIALVIAFVWAWIYVSGKTERRMSNLELVAALNGMVVKLLNALLEEQEHGYLLEEERDRLRNALNQIIDATYDIGMGRPDFRAIAHAAIEEETK